MKGINKFHRSLRGKRLHRSMGRFLATRYFLNPPKKKKGKSEALILSRDLALKAISSMRTHMYIEQGYYMPLSEQVEFEMFTDYALPILRTIESELYEDIQYEFSKDELELLLRLVEAGEMHKSIAEVLDIEVKEVEGTWAQHEGEEELALDYHSKLLAALEKGNVKASYRILAKHLDYMRKYSQTARRKAV